MNICYNTIMIKSLSNSTIKYFHKKDKLNHLEQTFFLLRFHITEVHQRDTEI